MLITITVILFISFLKGDLVNGCVSPCTCSATNVDCSNKNLMVIPQNIAPSTTNLFLSGNNLTLLRSDDLSSLTSLLYLFLNGNNLNSLPEGLFSMKTKLKVLSFKSLNNNNLESLPDGLLSSNTNLQGLDLTGNNLKSLPKGLFSMNTNLEFIGLDDNNLDSLPKGLFSMNTNLQYLDLNINNLESLPDGLLSSNTNLQELNIRGNPLKCCTMKNVIEQITTVPELGGTCEDFNTTTEIKSFNTSDCIIPVDGGWSPWSNSSCSVSCGDGVRIRNRTCDNPPPSDGGVGCVGSETETYLCNLRKCPVDGGWSPWSNSSCSVSCGDGVRIRNRTCDNPPPFDSGGGCVGSETETSLCNLRKCPVNGGWSPWINTTCSVTCGDGVIVKNRKCDNPTPSEGGLYCVGSETETSLCNLIKCPESCSHSKKGFDNN